MSFPVSQLFTSSGQSSGILASTSVLPMKIQSWFPLPLTGLISLQSKGFSRVFSNTTVRKHQLFGTQPFLWSNSHIGTWPLEKTIDLTRWIFVGKVMSLLFNMLSRSVLTFLPRSKCLNFMAAITVSSDFGAQESKICHCFHFSPILFARKWWDWMPWSLFFECCFKSDFPLFIPVVMTSGMACGLPTEAVSSFYVSYEFSPKAVLLKGIARQGTWWFYLAISEIRSFSQNQDFLSRELFKERPFFWRQFQKRSYWDSGSRDDSV